MLETYLRQHCYQGSWDVLVLVCIVKASCPSEVSTSTSSSNTVHIFINWWRKIIINDMLHIGNVESTSCHISGHHDGSSAVLEVSQSFFSFTLQSVSVERNKTQPLFRQSVPWDTRGITYTPYFQRGYITANKGTVYLTLLIYLSFQTRPMTKTFLHKIQYH